MAQQGRWNITNRIMLEDRGAKPKEDGDLLREYQAMHEENFLSSWLLEDVDGKVEERERLNEEAKQEEVKVGRERKGERSETSRKVNLYGSFRKS